jgi:hypothetical protein
MKTCLLALLVASLTSSAHAAEWTSLKVADAAGFVRTHTHAIPGGEMILGNGSQIFRQSAFGSTQLNSYTLGGLVVDPSFIAISPAGGLIGAGGFGDTGVHPFSPGNITQAPGAALTSLQNYDGVFWAHPTSGRSGWLIGGGNGTLTNGPFGDFEQHTITYVSTDGFVVKAVTTDISTYSAGMAVDASGNVYLGTSDVTPALSNRLLKFNADQIDGAITGTALGVGQATVVTTLPATGNLAVDSDGRVWSAGFEIASMVLWDTATSVGRLVKPDHPPLVDSNNNVLTPLYQVKHFTVNGVSHVSFLASDLFGSSGTPVLYGWKKAAEIQTRSVKFRHTNALVSESAGSILVEVQMSPPPTVKTTVPIKLSGTATSGGDYSILSRQVVFKPGQSSQMINIKIVADTLDEPPTPEELIIELDHPTPNAHAGLALSDTSYSLFIGDVDAPPLVRTNQNFMPARVGSLFDHTLLMSGGAAISFSAKGMPKGMTFNAKTGNIRGVPQVPGDYLIVVTARNSIGTTISEALLLSVADFSAVLKGSFIALGNVGARLDLTVSKDAAFTGKLYLGRKKLSIAGSMNVQSAMGVIDLSDNRFGQLRVEIDSVTGIVAAQLNGYALTGWRASTITSRQGRHHFAIAPGMGASQPEGSGYGSATVNSQAKVAVVGVTADNQTFTTSCPISEDGEFIIFQPLYTIAGHLAGHLQIDDDAGATLTGLVTWKKPTQNSSGLYPQGWTPDLSLSINGGKYHAVVGSSVFLNANAVVANNAELALSDGGVSTTSVDFNLGAPAKVRILAPYALKIDAKTGLVTGSLRGNNSTLTMRGIMVPDPSSAHPFDGLVKGFVINGTRSGALEVRKKP